MRVGSLDVRERSILVHALTAKGYGYEPAQNDPFRYHGVGKFEIESGKFPPSKPGPPKYQKVFAQTLIQLAKEDERIVAITAAMADGTSLDMFKKEFPSRFYASMAGIEREEYFEIEPEAEATPEVDFSGLRGDESTLEE